MDPTNDKCIKELTSCLITKMNLLEEILHFTKEQSQAIALGETLKLEELIDAKQKRMDAIDDLDKNIFLVKFAELKSFYGLASLHDAKINQIPNGEQLKEIVQELFKLMHQIEALERENHLKIKGEIQEVKGHIKTLNAFKVANKAYGGNFANPSPSYFIDKKK